MHDEIGGSPFVVQASRPKVLKVMAYSSRILGVQEVPVKQEVAELAATVFDSEKRGVKVSTLETQAHRTCS